MTIQMAIRLPEEMVVEVDRLVRDGRYQNRTEAVRAALQRLLDELRERQVDAAIVDGYQRVPDPAPEPWVEAAAEALVREEPW